MPAAAGAATDDVMPGTISNVDAGLVQGERLLAAAAEHERVAALEPDDALALARPSSTSSAEIISWGIGRPGRLPTSISSASAARVASTPSPTSASCTTTSASASKRAA